MVPTNLGFLNYVPLFPGFAALNPGYIKPPALQAIAALHYAP